MHPTNKQPVKRAVYADGSKMTRDFGSRVSLNTVMRNGGVTLQNLLWRPAAEAPVANLSSRNLQNCSLPITLDLLNQNKLEAVSRKLLRGALPAYAKPLVIYGSAPLLAPALRVETLAEVIQLGNSTGVEPRLHTIRVTPKKSSSSRAETTSDYDTILFCSGFVIGNKPTIIGAVFSGAADQEDLVRGSVRDLLEQLCADQITLTDIIQRCLQLPQLARVLIASETGALIWRNAIASELWDKCAPPIKYLAQTRSDAPKATLAAGEGQRVTLITLLRPQRRSLDARDGIATKISGEEAPVTRNFEIGDAVRGRLCRVIEGAFAQDLSRSASETGEDNPALRRLNQMSQFDSQSGSDEVQRDRRSEKSERLASVTIEAESDSPRLEAGRRALEVALRHLPEGGQLKLSPLNSKGEIRVESFDGNGDETMDITIKDREFPESDDIL